MNVLDNFERPSEKSGRKDFERTSDPIVRGAILRSNEKEGHEIDESLEFVRGQFQGSILELRDILMNETGLSQEESLKRIRQNFEEALESLPDPI